MLFRSIYYAMQISAPEGMRAFLEKREAEFTDTLSKDAPPYFPWWE